jgi:hypothetical protein
VSAALVLLTAIPVAAQDVRLTPDQQREFLRTAKVINARPIGKGVTNSLRLTLTNGVVTHDAAFQSINERASDTDRRNLRKRAGELNFVDSYMYNIAAYELATLLGLDDMMPATVDRTYQGRRGSLTWWVDDVLMDEAERERTNTQPPSGVDFQRERMRMIVFAELIGDIDRNKGNVLYTKDWRVIMIDFTRAFRLHPELRQPTMLTVISRDLWHRLQKLTRQDVNRVADRYLNLGEVGAMMQRHKALIDHYARRIETYGESGILY